MLLRLLQWLIAQERLMRWAAPWFGPFHPFLPEYRREPDATWRRLREEAPVAWSRPFQAWVLSRYDDVLEVLHDKRFSADRRDTQLMRFTRWTQRRDPDFLAFLDRNLLMIDGPDHKRLRRLVAKAFTPRQVERLRPELQRLVDACLDPAAEGGRMEVMRDLAEPFPVAAIAALLGVPTQDRARFRAWSEALVGLLDPLQMPGGLAPARRAIHELNDYFRPFLEARRREPRDDLISAMIAAEEDGARLQQADLLALCALLLVAGHETTSNLIGNAVLTLLRHPDEHKRLRDDPALIHSAVDELLRFEGPILATDRAVLEDMTFRGRHFRRGQFVLVLLAAANRDPAHFSEPDHLDLGRQENDHLAFGHGSHYCMGSQLAHLEAELALGSLVRRFPHFSGAPDPLAWRTSMILRGPTAVPLRLV